MANPGDNATGAGTGDPDPQTPPLVTKADDLDAFRTSVVDAASVSAGLWITYLGVLFYLLIAIGSVTHKDLFLDSPIKLPFMNVDLPTKGFFSLGPALFIIVHAYVLLHFVMLAGKIRALDQELITQIADQAARTQVRRQLPANIFVQLLAGPSEVRDGVIGVFLWLIALISLVIGPVLLLLFFELQFLPYHNELVTWWQRIAVGLDLGLLWLFWPAIALRRSETAPMAQPPFGIARKIQRVGTIGIMLILTLGSPPLLLLVATFPGETLQKHLVEIPGKAMLIDGELSSKTLLPESPFSSLLMLPKFDAVGQAKLDSREKLDYMPQSITVQGRYLQGMNLKLADLRKANLIADDLSRADLGSANLTDAQLDLADLTNAQLDYANLTGANLTDANLTGANLTGAKLDGAILSGAKLDGQAQLDQACGKGARLPPGLTLKPCPDVPVAPPLNPGTTP
jgi:pentapeptide repeat protein